MASANRTTFDEEPIKCVKLSKFKMGKYIGKGAFGKVYVATNKRTRQDVAIKAIKLHDSGTVDEESQQIDFSKDQKRELEIQWKYKHPNIVQLLSIARSPDTNSYIYFVMELMDKDLASVCSKRSALTPEILKQYMHDILSGLSYLHQNGIIHRDLKPDNFLLDKSGVLKIGDLGLARSIDDIHECPLTPKPGSLWYMAPEMLLGMHYNTTVDMWAVGCVMAELITGRILFTGLSEIQLLKEIFSVLGTPTETSWPECTKILRFHTQYEQKDIQTTLQVKPGSVHVSDCGYDFLRKCLMYRPQHRITSHDALHHDWFLH